MLKIDKEKKKLDKLQPSDLVEQNILERIDFQEMIKNSWELVREEIGIPNAIFIGDEVRTHADIQDAIDILAYDPDDSSLIIIELKRGKNKYQLLQSLSYAAMANEWDVTKIIEKIKNSSAEAVEELKQLLLDATPENSPKIILISEKYEPEVILTSDWLSSHHGVNITAFSVTVHSHDKQTFLQFNQKYPLAELSEQYEMRRKVRTAGLDKKNVSWENVFPNLQYDFAKKGIDACLKESSGDPGRRRFGSIRSHYDGFDWISLHFRNKKIVLYTRVNKEVGRDKITEVFGSDADIKEWRDGLSLDIVKLNQFEKMLKWLKLN